MNREIHWGKILVGAAVAAGAIAALAYYPQVGFKIAEGVGAAAGWLWHTALGVPEAAAVTAAAAKGASAAAITTAVESSKGLLEFIVSSKAAAIGTAALTGAAVAGSLTTEEDRAERTRERFDDESFAIREDMRRTQALMQARMAAAGYQPAMAMARA